MAHTPQDEKLADEFFGAAARETHLAGRDVIEGARVRLVYHDPDDGWWFSSGGDDEDEELGHSCLPCLLHRDPGLVEIASLPLNWIAERGDDDATWRREQRPPDWGLCEPADEQG